MSPGKTRIPQCVHAAPAPPLADGDPDWTIKAVESSADQEIYVKMVISFGTLVSVFLRISATGSGLTTSILQER